MRGIVESVTKKDYLRFLTHLGELIDRDMQLSSKQVGQKISRNTMIVDMDQMDVRQFTSRLGY